MMQPSELVAQFCELVNEGLATGADRGTVAYERLKAVIQPGIADSNNLLLDEALEEVYQCYRDALKPPAYFNAEVTEADLRFNQCYFLLREILDKAVVGPRDNFAASLARDPQIAGLHPFIVIGRFWEVSGPQKYAASGRLMRFDYDPLVSTNGIVSTVSGDYMSMEGSARTGEGIGTLGQMVTRPDFRGGGHGTLLNQAFEEKVNQIAASRGEVVRLFVLEAEARARTFWFRQGYRYPLGSQYVQPAIAYDPETGEGLFPEMTEMIMVKPCLAQDAASIDAQLLVDAMRTLYERWYIPDYLSEPAHQRVTAHVIGDLLASFKASLAKENGRVPLVAPPAD